MLALMNEQRTGRDFARLVSSSDSGAETSVSFFFLELSRVSVSELPHILSYRRLTFRFLGAFRFLVSFRFLCSFYVIFVHVRHRPRSKQLNNSPVSAFFADFFGARRPETMFSGEMPSSRVFLGASSTAAASSDSPELLDSSLDETMRLRAMNEGGRRKRRVWENEKR